MTKSSKKKNKQKDTYTGRLDMSRSGIGYVVVEGLERDIIVRPGSLANALNGDEVRVEVMTDAGRGRRMEGEITQILRRKQSEFSGRIEVHPHFAFLIPDNEKMGVDIYVPLHLLNGATDGDHAMARIVEWNGKTKNPVGEVISVLTEQSVNEIAMQGLLVENGFPLTFPDDVLEEAARYPDGVSKDELKHRKDMRKVLTMTIDPVDAKDFDDALSIRALRGGWYEVGVHIADVSYYIQPDSALDKEAYRRATSVYLPDRVSPMLPERLSNELCSLRPNEDKYTFSAIFTINKQGKVKDTWLGRTVIHSRRRFTYEDVQEILEGADGDHAKELHLLNGMARSLRAARFEKGAINFSSQEVRFKLDEDARPIGITVKESKESHQLIEEFMLLANRAVAEYVGEQRHKDKAVPFPYRVHDVPDPDKLRAFTSFAAHFGVRFNLGDPASIAASFNVMLATVQGKPEQHVLEQLGIRTMAKAVYTTENIGHYGLGFAHYCHFTSPIRRYPDVLVHRILQECLDGNIHPMKHLEQQCRHCSDQERRAMDTERAANKYKQVEYMQQFLGDEFEAVISGVAAFGFWAETVEHKCEGMISVTDLQDIDIFELRETEYALVGRTTDVRFAMGDHVTIRVAATNLSKRQIDFVLANAPQPVRRRQRKETGRPQTAKRGKATQPHGTQKKQKTNKKRK